MTLQDFDYSIIYTRPDGSYIINRGLYHVPKEGEWTELWAEIDAYAKEHPDIVQPEPQPEQHEDTPEEIIKRYSDAVQDALDAFAQTRRYDGIMSACSYASSTDPVFAAEAAYCITLRDETWRQAYSIMDAVIAGTHPMPTVAELLSELPVGSAQWPNAAQE